MKYKDMIIETLNKITEEKYLKAIYNLVMIYFVK